MEIVEISLWLFGKPEWEFTDGINPSKISAMGDELKTRLTKTADDLEQLIGNGWDYDMTLYDLMLTKNISKSDAEKELKRLKIDAEIILLEDEE